MKNPKSRQGDLTGVGPDELAEPTSIDGASHDNKAYEAARKRAEARGEREASPEDYEALAQALHELRRLHPDDLDAETNLYNSDFFARYLRHATNQNNSEGREFSLLLFEIDGLNEALTTINAQERIVLLAELSKELYSVVGYEHWGFRISVDEFAIAFSGVDKEGAEGARERLTSIIENARWVRAIAKGFRLKSGVAVYPADGRDGAALVRRARAARENVSPVEELNHE